MMLTAPAVQPIGVRRTHRRGYGKHGMGSQGPVCALVAQDPGIRQQRGPSHVPHIELLPPLPQLPLQPVCITSLDGLTDAAVAPLLLSPGSWSDSCALDIQHQHNDQLRDPLGNNSGTQKALQKPQHTWPGTAADSSHVSTHDTAATAHASYSSDSSDSSRHDRGSHVAVQGKGMQLGGRQLAAHLNAVTSLEELQHLHEKEGSLWDPVHVVAALSKAAKASELVKCAQPEPPAWALPMLTTLMTEAMLYTQLGRYKPRQLSTLLWVVAKLQLCQHSQGVQLLDAVTHAFRRQHQHANTGIRRQAHKPRQHEDSSRHRRAQQYVAVSAQDISNSMWALVRFGIALPACTQHLKPADGLPHETAEKLRSLWLVLVPHIPACSQRMGAQEVSNTMWALAHAGAVMPTHPAHTAPRAQQDLEDLRLGVVDAVQALSQRAVQLSGQLDRQHVPLIAWACAVMQYRDPVLLDALASRALHTSMLRNLTAQGLSLLAWAYATLQYPHSSLLVGLQQCATWKVGKFRVQGLANFQWGMSKLTALQQQSSIASRTPTISRMSASSTGKHNGSTAKATNRTSEQVHTEAPVNVESGGAPVHGPVHQPPGGMSLMSLAAREAVYKMDEAQPLSLATLLQVWAESGYYNVSLFSSAVARAHQLLPSFLPHTLVTLLAAVSHVGHTDLPFMEAAARQLLPWVSGGGSSSRHIQDDSSSMGQVSTICPCSLQQVLQLAFAYGTHHHSNSLPATALLRALVPGLTTALQANQLDAAQLVKLAVAYAPAGVHVPASKNFALVVTPGHGSGVSGDGSGTGLLQLQQGASAGQHAADGSAVAASDLGGMVQLLCHQLQAHAAQLTPAQLAAATWAMVALQAPNAGSLVHACVDRMPANPMAWGRFCGSISPRWRVRLAWALAKHANVGFACITPHVQLQQQGQGQVMAARTQLSAARQLADGLQDELHLLDANTLLQLAHVLQLTAVPVLPGQPSASCTGAADSPSAAAAAASTAAAAGGAAPVESIATDSAYIRVLVHELSSKLEGMMPWQALQVLAHVPSSIQAPLQPLMRQNAARFMTWAAMGASSNTTGYGNSQPSARTQLSQGSRYSSSTSHHMGAVRRHHAAHTQVKGRQSHGQSAASRRHASTPQLIVPRAAAATGVAGPAAAAAERLTALLQGWQALESMSSIDQLAVQKLATAVMQATVCLVQSANHHVSDQPSDSGFSSSAGAVQAHKEMVQAAAEQLGAAAAEHFQLRPMLLQLHALLNRRPPPPPSGSAAPASTTLLSPSQHLSPAQQDGVVNQQALLSHVPPALKRSVGAHAIAAHPPATPTDLLWVPESNSGRLEAVDESLLPKPQRHVHNR